jgi:hypothetical protein
VRLSVKLKRELRDWIVNRSPQPAEELELSPALRIAMTDYASGVAERAAEYARLRDEYVEVDPRKLGGTPVIRGTRVHIPEEAYEVAVIWARGNPRRGRPSDPSQKGRTRPSRRAATAA